MRAYATHAREDYGREEEDRVSLRQFRVTSFQKWAQGNEPTSLAEWLCSDRWTDVTPFLGTHNQPPVSGEINHRGWTAAEWWDAYESYSLG